MSKTQTITDLSQQVTDLTQKYQRALADYQNLEKRTQQQQANFLRIISSNLINKFLNILDNLEKASQHIQDPGLHMVLSDFYQVLKDEGVIEIKAVDQEFNPAEMECVELVSGPKNKVIKVATKGYRINDQILRPAKVEVGKG